MAYNVIVVIIALMGISSPALAQRETTSTSPSTTPTTWIDPHAGGKSGNPGARAFVNKKSMDAVHVYVADTIAKAISGMTFSDLVLPVGAGVLTIKPPRVTEADYGKTEYQMVPPNRIRSRFFDGRLAANGVWQYKPYGGDLVGGTFKTTIQGAELNATTQLGRSVDAKPTIQPVECKADISQFRVEVQGSAEIKVIEDCEMEICVKIRGFYERAICQLFEGYVKEVLNRELQLVPNRVCIEGDYKVDYGLLYNEPTVNDTDKCIRAGMEGKYIWRGSSGVPFNAPEMEWTDRSRMYSFQVSDFTFNTLLHQAHSSGYRFSAAELESSSMRQLLSLNCGDSPTPKPTSTTARSTTSPPKTTKPTSKPTSPTTTRPKPTKANPRKYRGPPGAGNFASYDVKCLGSLFANLSNYGPYSASDTGDIVYKSSQKAAAVYVESDKRGFFDGSNGILEFYGPLGSGNRPLLARVDVRLMRGDFVPKLDKANITGSMKLNSFQLAQSTIQPDWLAAAASFSKPIVTESLNAFLDRFAQFPVPLPHKYECISPLFSVMDRTMQIDCDVQRAIKERKGCACISAAGTCACDNDSISRAFYL